MNTDQSAKLVHRPIRLTNTFLDLMVKCKKKTHNCYSIEKVASKAVRE